jgi:hypothetical protein
MKKILKTFIKSGLSASILLAMVTACLEDRGYTDIIESVSNTSTISMFGSENGVFAFAVPVSRAEKVSIKVTGGRLQNDVTVKLRLNPGAVAEHNHQITLDGIAAGDTLKNGMPDFTKIDLFDLLPDSVFTLPSMEITVPKESKDGEFTFTVNSSKMSLNDNYLLPFFIESVSDPDVQIANNLRSVLLYVQVKNAFDGKYKVKIGQSGWLAFMIYDGPPLDYPGTISLATSGANSAALINDFANSALCPGLSDATPPGATAFGAATPVFNFSADGKLTSVSNPGADSRNRQFVLNPAATAIENKFDLTAKSFVFNLLFKQNGRPDMTMKFIGKYEGPR